MLNRLQRFWWNINNSGAYSIAEKYKVTYSVITDSGYTLFKVTDEEKIIDFIKFNNGYCDNSIFDAEKKLLKKLNDKFDVIALSMLDNFQKKIKYHVKQSVSYTGEYVAQVVWELNISQSREYTYDDYLCEKHSN